MSNVQFLKDLIFQQTEKIEQGFIAEIVSFDSVKMKAEIKPLLEHTTEVEGKTNKKTIKSPNIPDVHCSILYGNGYYIRPEYKKGDLVVYVPIDSLLPRCVPCRGRGYPPLTRTRTRALYGRTRHPF